MMEMEAVRNEAPVQDKQMHGLKPTQYMQVVQQAMQHMQWTITALQPNSISAAINIQDPYSAIATIACDSSKARLQVRPMNEYYFDKDQTGKAVARLEEVIAALAQQAHVEDRNLHPMHREKWGALVPSQTYLATPLLVYANVLVFVAMVVTGISPLHPTAQQLYVWGGNLRPAVTHGDWWRLISYMFLHGGIVHLVMNTIALLYIGMFLEPLMGRLRFTGAYLLTGICAGLMSMAMHPASVGVGASGAIFGMYGVFLSLLTTNYIRKTLRKTMLRSILFFVLLNLLWGLEGNTDNAAHIGGLLSGILIGRIYVSGILKQHSLKKQIATTVAVAICVFVAVLVSVAALQ